jgi:hypothetical protein
MLNCFAQLANIQSFIGTEDKPPAEQKWAGSSAQPTQF